MNAMFTIPGRLPGLNEFISSARGRPWWACRNAKNMAMRNITAILVIQKVPKFDKPVKIRIKWIEKDARRDRDNVTSGGIKCLLDCMKHIGIIVNDTRKWVADVQHDTTIIDKKNPRVEVWISDEWIK